MEHVVFFPASDGSPAFRRVDSLEAAVRLVERLSNDEGISEVTVHALSHVELTFTTYVRVEVPSAAEAAAPVEAPVVEAAPEAEVAPAPEPVAEPVAELAGAEAPAEPEEPDSMASEAVLVPASGEANGRREVSGLGFFAS